MTHKQLRDPREALNNLIDARSESGENNSKKSEQESNAQPVNRVLAEFEIVEDHVFDNNLENPQDGSGNYNIAKVYGFMDDPDYKQTRALLFELVARVRSLPQDKRSLLGAELAPLLEALANDNNLPVQQTFNLSAKKDLLELGKFIGAARKRAGYSTQQKFGDKIDMTQGHYSKIEQGKVIPSPKTLEKICDLTGMEPVLSFKFN